MLDVVRSDGLIQVKSDRISFALHLDTLAMELADSDGRTTLSGFLPRVVTSRGMAIAEKTITDAYGEIRTRLGVATRVQVRARLTRELDLTLALDFSEDWSGAILDLTLENRGSEPETVSAIDPCWWNARAGGQIALPHEPGSTSFFCMGFQSHSRSGYVPLTKRGSAQAHAHPDPCEGPLTPAWGPNQFVSDFATQLCAPDRGGLTVGFLTHEHFFNHVSLRTASGQITELVARVPTEQRVLTPRSSLRAERLWLGTDPPGSDGIATWAEHTAREMGVAVRPGPTVAWSSRHSDLGSRGVFPLREACAALRDLDAGVQLVEIDEGYESRLGDWLEPSDGFPEGVALACREIEEFGLAAGVWIAPFVASADSQLVQQHPDWLARELDGRSGVPFKLAGRERPCVALDPSHPELRAWLGELTRTLYAAGCRRLRLDWLSAGARPALHRSGETTVEAYRGALLAIREAAPETPWLVAGRAPLGPSIGLVDAMRSGPDLALPWQPRKAWLRSPAPTPGAEAGVCNALARAPLSRLWQTDPDCLLLRETENPLTATELRTVASTALLCGGLISFSGSIRDFSAERCRWLRRLLPPLARNPEIGAPVRGSRSLLLTRFPDGSALVLVPNLDSHARSFELDLPQLGLSGAQHAWDVFGERALGVLRGRWSSERVPPHGALLIRFSPADGKPRLIGSSLHLSAGGLEVARLRREADGALALRLRQPGRRSGSLVLVPSEGTPVAIEVSFDEQLDLQVSSLGLENLAKIPDS